jgi:hypothetical protein
VLATFKKSEIDLSNRRTNGQLKSALDEMTFDPLEAGLAESDE